MVFVLSHTIIETSSKLLRVSLDVTRSTELRPLFNIDVCFTKKIVTSLILPFVVNEMCNLCEQFLICKRLQLRPDHIRNTF